MYNDQLLRVRLDIPKIVYNHRKISVLFRFRRWKQGSAVVSRGGCLYYVNCREPRKAQCTLFIELQCTVFASVHTKKL